MWNTYDVELPIREYHLLHACVFVPDDEKLNQSLLAQD